MAVIDAIPGLEASIEVGRQPLQEYRPRPEDDTDNDEHTTRYVVTEPGQEFRVVVKRDKSFLLGGPEYDVMCYLYIDGNHIWGIPIRKGQLASYEVNFNHRKDRLPDGRQTKRNFVFSELAFDNDRDPPISAKEVKEAKMMGSIELKLFQGNYGPATDKRIYNTQLTIGGPVHEKALKGRAMSRSVELGEAQLMTAKPEPTADPQSASPPGREHFHKHDKKAFAVFTFKYRSLADLKTELIIPRDPSPVPLEERPEASVSAELKPELIGLRSSSPALLEARSQGSLLRDALSAWRPRTRAETARAARGGLSREENSAWRPRTRAETARVNAEAPQRATRERWGADAGITDEIENYEPQIKRQRVIEMVDLTGD